jgi:hypothetical protein
MKKRYKTLAIFNVAITLLLSSTAFAQCLKTISGNYTLNGSISAKIPDTCCVTSFLVFTGSKNTPYAYGDLDTTNCIITYYNLDSSPWNKGGDPDIGTESTVKISATYDTITAIYWIEDDHTWTVVYGPDTDIYIRNVTGIESIINTISIQTWPNPAKQYLNYSINCNAPEVSIKVVDIMGKCIYQTQVKANEFHSGHSINIQSFASGVYVLQVSSDKYVSNTKFIKE